LAHFFAEFSAKKSRPTKKKNPEKSKIFLDLKNRLFCKKVDFFPDLQRKKSEKSEKSDRPFTRQNDLK